MTKMTISGLEKMIDDMERMSSNFKPMAEGILKDGAQIIVGEWKREASKRTQDNRQDDRLDQLQKENQKRRIRNQKQISCRWAEMIKV